MPAAPWGAGRSPGSEAAEIREGCATLDGAAATGCLVACRRPHWLCLGLMLPWNRSDADPHADLEWACKDQA